MKLFVTARLRNKWREIPTITERIFSSDLVGRSDAEFRKVYDDTETLRRDLWYRAPYGERVAGKDVLDVGCGFALDTIHFIRCGARVTFSDIVRDNLKATKRAVDMLGLEADYYFIDNPHRFKLTKSYDFIFALGSLHHAPFDFVQKEIASLATFLKPGGTFCFFAYPRERFEQSGAKDFAEFGRVTDGERTPWAEWYDDAKIRRLFGSGFDLVFSKNFGRSETEFNWFELRHHGSTSSGSAANN